MTDSHSKSRTLWQESDPFCSSIGLWRQAAPGHTAGVAHLAGTCSGPDAASRLVSLASAGAAGQFAPRVIKALSQLQQKDPSREKYGGFRWYWEETEIADTNAAFFIGLNLIVLWDGYRDQLDEGTRGKILEMFTHLDHWFDHEISSPAPYYPNKFLGDVVCSFLLKEIMGLPAPEGLLRVAREAGGYWRDQHWGWGEHLSDSYATIMINELSCLLLISKHLPSDLRELYCGLFGDLLAIDDAFANGPRVPAIRSYAFNSYLPNEPFRAQLPTGNPSEDKILNASQLPHLRPFPFGSFFKKRGWEMLAGAAPTRQEIVKVPCWRDAEHALPHCRQMGREYGGLAFLRGIPERHQAHPADSRSAVPFTPDQGITTETK